MPNPKVALSRTVSRRSNIGEKSKEFNTQRFVGAVADEIRAKELHSVTQSQLELIDHLRKCLDDAGVANDFIIVPDNRMVASHVIRALIRLAQNHNVDTGRGRKTLNGI